MNFECENCNAGVNKIGDLCDKCLEDEMFAEHESLERRFAGAQLCAICGNLDDLDRCTAYRMPLWMVKRKFRCKHYVGTVVVGD